MGCRCRGLHAKSDRLPPSEDRRPEVDIMNRRENNIHTYQYNIPAQESQYPGPKAPSRYSTVIGGSGKCGKGLRSFHVMGMDL